MATDTPQALEGENELGIIWGSEAIGAAIGVNPRRAHYMLTEGELPGARKVGGRWSITRRRLKEIFEGTL
jgi:hypothetical protein